jgi:hypothetical protein
MVDVSSDQRGEICGLDCARKVSEFGERAGKERDG